MRHEPQLTSDIKRMRVSGFTLSEIMSKTGLAKTTIYHHVKNIPKSKLLREKLYAITLAKQKKQADARRGKSVKPYTFLQPEKWTAEFVDLVAHFLFDGEIKYSGCIYNNRNKVLIGKIISLMAKILNVDDYKLIKKGDGVWRVSYFNVEIASFIKSKAAELLTHIYEAPIKLRLAFLKAFFDDEGAITFIGTKRVVRGYQHSVMILELIQKLLLNFGVESKIDRKYMEISVGRRQNLERFQECINFSPDVRVNGARSNSVWKKSLEKREILRMALASYL